MIDVMGLANFEVEIDQGLLRQSQDQISGINENISLIGSDMNASYQKPMFTNMSPPVVNVQKSQS